MTIEEIWGDMKLSLTFSTLVEAMISKLQAAHPTMVVGESIIANFTTNDEGTSPAEQVPNLSICVTKGTDTFILVPVFGGIPLTNLKPIVVPVTMFDDDVDALKFERERNGAVDS